MVLPNKLFNKIFNLIRWAIVFLSISLLLLLFFRDSVIKIDQSIYYSRVEKRLSKSMDDVVHTSDLIVEQIKTEGGTFTDLNKIPTKSLFYIFDKGKPFYWSTSEYIPNYNSKKQPRFYNCNKRFNWRAFGHGYS